MFEKIRDKMRDLIRSLDYVMTIHGEEEMESDNLSILDVENAVLTGNIVERQRDENWPNQNISSPAKLLMTWTSLLWQN